MKKYFTTGVLILYILLFESCNSPTETLQQYKHPQEMTWTADTITYPGSAQVLMGSIWASSPNDVWIVGHNDRSVGNVWHFDGAKWYDVSPLQNFYKSPNTFAKVSAKSTNDIWFVGDRTFSDPNEPYGRRFEDLIIQYKYGTWIEHDLNTNFRILSINCVSDNEIYVCGDNGFVAKYDGIKWEKDTIKIIYPKDGSYFLRDVAKYNNKINLLANFNSTYGGKYYFIQGDINKWVIADTNGLDLTSLTLNWGQLGLHVGGDNKLYSYGSGGVWQWNNEWKIVLDNNLQIWGLTILREDYKIACGVKRNVYFFNGYQWNIIEALKNVEENTVYRDAWTNGNEIFIIGNLIDSYPQKTIVWHGK
ncbi:MAG: hypothetical protein RDU14_12550 [Melioribacteraceae bacterium]|nr:hypothetical protein [Melioribacteraceae bacterium]